MDSLDAAYYSIAQYCLNFAEDRSWDKILVRFEILSKMVSAKQVLFSGTTENRKGGFKENRDSLWEGLDAALYLRDHMLNLTGDRIWGLTFTLYPDGKFEIEYDYNKPEDYEETDEVITGEEINQRLNDLFSPKS